MRSENRVVQIKAVYKIFMSAEASKTTEALENIVLDITEGEFVSLLGPSGCGKTTLLRIIGGLESPSQGEVIIEGERVTSPHPKVAFVFQEVSIFPWRTVLDNIQFGLEIKKINREARRDRSLDIIEKVGLNGFGDYYPRQISGGMQQRVAIARALVLNPDILLLDEPFGALDEQTRLIMGLELQTFREVGEEEGRRKTIIMVTHSIGESILLSDRVCVMSFRPGTIKGVVDIHLPRPRTAETLKLNEFKRLEDEILDMLKEESVKAMKQRDQAPKK